MPKFTLTVPLSLMDKFSFVEGNIHFPAPRTKIANLIKTIYSRNIHANKGERAKFLISQKNSYRISGFKNSNATKKKSNLKRVDESFSIFLLNFISFRYPPGY